VASSKIGGALILDSTERLPNETIEKEKILSIFQGRKKERGLKKGEASEPRRKGLGIFAKPAKQWGLRRGEDRDLGRGTSI